MPFKPLDGNSTPLAPDQAEQLNRLIGSLSTEQIVWVSGYLAGVNAANQDAVQPQQGAVADNAPELSILFASQTGNAEEIANQVRDQARARGFRASMQDMANIHKRHFKQARNLLVIASTHGEGDPPDNALDLYELLNGPKAPKLDGTRFSVLALGDASYEHFCQTGRDFDERLEALGATRLHPRADCDVDFEEAAQAWIDAALGAFSEALEPAAPTASSTGVRTPDTSVYSKKHPFAAAVLDNIVLNARGSDKEVRHVELSLEGSGLVYEPGDSVGVVPSNDPELVSEIIDTLALSPDEGIEAGDNTTLEQALTHGYEITTLTRPVLANYAEIAESSALRRLLQDDHKAELKAFLQEHHLIDLLQEYPVRGLTAAGVVRLLRKLPPRLYSISSSYQASPDEVHLTVAAVRYRSRGRERKGVASIQLAERMAIGDTVPIYIDHNKNFKPPQSPDTPVIMVGPGTGVAPFRAFLQEREEQGADGRNWLFFGDRRFRSDFLYQAEWLKWRKRGLLTRLDVAFSRDREEKAYVQHRMRANARDVYGWLEEGAHLYVCGDADRMAQDVHATLVDIVAEQGGKGKDAAEIYVRELQKSRRYQRDVY